MKTLLLMIGALIASCPLLLAQPGPMPPPHRPDPKAMERLEHLRKLKLIETLDLNEDQSIKFMVRLNEQDKMRKELRKQRGEKLDRIDQLVASHASPEEYERAFADLYAIDQKLAESHKAFMERLKDLLTPEQRAKVILFDRRFEDELREAIHDVRQRHMQADQQDR